MSLLSNVLLGLLFCGTSFKLANPKEDFDLIKRSEIYLYRPRYVGTPWSKNYQMRPLFSRLPTGESFFIERCVQQGMAYFFAPDGELNRMVMLMRGNPTGRPGNMSSVTTVFKNSSNEFGAYDLSRRINLFDPESNLSRSLIIPAAFRSSVIMSGVVDQKTLALGGLYKQDDGVMSPVVYLIDLENPSVDSFTICKNAHVQATSKGANAFIAVHATPLSSGKIACNVNTYPNVCIARGDGTLLEEDALPPHFRSLAEAGKLEAELENEEGCLTREAEEWLSTWTHSYPPYEYSQNRLIVPRVLYPTFYLDLYSYSDKEISYLGYVSTDKRFLFADSSGAYLLEEEDDTSMVIGNYEIVSADYREERGTGWTIKRLRAEELSGIRRVAPDTSEPCPDRKKHKPKGYLTRIDTFKLISADSVEYLLADSLSTDKGHLILFGGPQDCFLYRIFNVLQNTVRAKPDSVDLTIVLTHPYSDELKGFIRFARMNWDCSILSNTDWERLEPIIKSKLSVLEVTKEGTIVYSADYPGFEPQPR